MFTPVRGCSACGGGDGGGGGSLIYLKWITLCTLRQCTWVRYVNVLGYVTSMYLRTLRANSYIEDISSVFGTLS